VYWVRQSPRLSASPASAKVQCISISPNRMRRDGRGWRQMGPVIMRPHSGSCDHADPCARRLRPGFQAIASDRLQAPRRQAPGAHAPSQVFSNDGLSMDYDSQYEALRIRTMLRESAVSSVVRITRMNALRLALTDHSRRRNRSEIRCSLRALDLGCNRAEDLQDAPWFLDERLDPLGVERLDVCDESLVLLHVERAGCLVDTGRPCIELALDLRNMLERDAGRPDDSRESQPCLRHPRAHRPGGRDHRLCRP
jgi:hypothetical protein